MRYRDWDDPRVGERKAGLLDRVLTDIGATEVASAVMGDDSAFRVLVACDLGLLVMDWVANETPVAPTLTGGLSRWHDVGPIGLGVDFQWPRGTEMVPTLRLTIEKPDVVVETVRDHLWHSPVSDATAGFIAAVLRLGRVPPQ